MSSIDYSQWTGNPNGFHRLSGFPEVYPPWLVFNWVYGKRTEPRPESPVRAALKKLNAYALQTPETDERYRRTMPAVWRDPDSGSGIETELHTKLLRLILGLDQDQPSRQLRLAVARAWLAAWRYADLWVDRKEHRNVLQDMLSENRYERVALAISEHVQFTQALQSFTSKDHSNYIETAIRCHEGTAAIHLNALKLNLTAINSELTRQKPENFLLLRLMEIYAFCLERPVTFHATGKMDKNETSPDLEMVKFIQCCLTLFGHPTLYSSKDRSLRTIADQINIDLLDELSNLDPDDDMRRLTFLRSYGELNSTGWLAHYGNKPKEELSLYQSLSI
ncbi:hypothetical protein ACKTEK_08850 [Tepidamorphus sp. 3E244]|uniref:hypothetical protein n=1 Tax=Tepidamorphus sp. 3E244 TaxID=3385498 RepID=UPI0038FC257D